MESNPKTNMKLVSKGKRSTRREKQKHKQNGETTKEVHPGAPPGWTAPEPQVMYSYGSNLQRNALHHDIPKPGVDIEVQYTSNTNFTGNTSDDHISMTAYVDGKAADIRIPINKEDKPVVKSDPKTRTKEKRLMTTWVDGKKMMFRRCPECNTRPADTGCYHCKIKLCSQCQHEHMKPYIMQAAQVAKDLNAEKLQQKSVGNGKELEVLNVYPYEIKDGKKKKKHELPKEIPPSLLGDSPPLDNSNMLIIHTRTSKGMPTPTAASLLNEIKESMDPPTKEPSTNCQTYHATYPAQEHECRDTLCPKKAKERMTIEEEETKMAALQLYTYRIDDDNMPMSKIKYYLTVDEFALMLRIYNYVSQVLDPYEFHQRELNIMKNRMTEYQKETQRKLKKYSANFSMEAMLDIQRRVDIFKKMTEELVNREVRSPGMPIYSEDRLIDLDEKLQILMKGSKTSKEPLKVNLCRTMITRIRKSKFCNLGFRIRWAKDRRKGDKRITQEEYNKNCGEAFEEKEKALTPAGVASLSNVDKHIAANVRKDKRNAAIYVKPLRDKPVGPVNQVEEMMKTEDVYVNLAIKLKSRNEFEAITVAAGNEITKEEPDDTKDGITMDDIMAAMDDLD